MLPTQSVDIYVENQYADQNIRRIEYPTVNCKRSMATVCLFDQVLYSKTRLATYLPGINGLVHHFASTMGYSTVGSYGSGDPHAAVATSINGPLRLQHDETMSPSNVKDHLHCMPGSVGFESNLKVSKQKRILTEKMIPDPLPTPSRPERCISGLLIKDFFHDPATNHSTREENQDLDNSSVECIIQSCPEKLKQDLQYLFPEASSSHVTVITVTQKTKNEMTAWCLAVEEERDHMLDKFVDGAKEICFILHREGFWADFIDPSSGLAFFGLVYYHEGKCKCGEMLPTSFSSSPNALQSSQSISLTTCCCSFVKWSSTVVLNLGSIEP
ncbi:cobalamin trafficking protein CblD-like isoform X3 [Syngnathus scovelli]|uniref:cobalamin trafficking protein CblD-like isoform X3 n=1 Tax=Syngnathus scovelli TaxID=161590 RepID=UPI0035CBFE2E